jgi:hypothetical protein
MRFSVAFRFASVILVMTLCASAAPGYIHFPPMTVPKMCKVSNQIRLLKVEKVRKEKGVIIFEVAQSLKGEKSRITSFKHIIKTDAMGTKPILDWAGEGKMAVLFWIEAIPSHPVGGLGYVFLDGYCYSVHYNREGTYWAMIRAEPGMSACYHGSVEQLQGLVKDILDGKKVKIPTRAIDTKEDADKRRAEINEYLNKNPKIGQ